MKRVFHILALALLFANCTETGDPCAKFDKVDRQMLDLIKKIKQKHASNKKFLSKLTKEQVFWIQYRDSHLEAIYPNDWDRHYRKNYGKEVFNPCKCKEMVRFTENRIEELNLWLSGGPSEQSDCPSLWNE